MKAFKEDKLTESCIWFNSLKDNVQISIIDWITDKSEDLSLSSNDHMELNKLIQNITALIIDSDSTEDEIKHILINKGLEKIVANAFYDFCSEIADPYLDAKILASLSIEKVKNASEFVLNHAILYDDYWQYEFDNFVQITGLDTKESARSVFSFIRHQYEQVSKRELSPSSLYNELQEKYSIPEEFAKAIILPIQTNELIANISQLFREIDKIKTLLTNPENLD